MTLKTGIMKLKIQLW